MQQFQSEQGITAGQRMCSYCYAALCSDTTVPGSAECTRRHLDIHRVRLVAALWYRLHGALQLVRQHLAAQLHAPLLRGVQLGNGGSWPVCLTSARDQFEGRHMFSTYFGLRQGPHTPKQMAEGS